MKYTTLVIALVFVSQGVFAKTVANTISVDTVLVDENVTYKFSQDEKYVFLNISTSDEKVMMSMLRLGVSVFFDVKGKRKKNVFVKYPAEPMGRNRAGVERGQKGQRGEKGGKREAEREIISDKEEEQRRKDRIIKMLENDYSQKAIYSYFESEEEFNILLNNTDIVVAFNFNEAEGILEYSLSIPKSKFNSDSKKDLSKLSIGIKTSKEERDGSNGEGINGNIGGISLGGQGGQGRGGRRSGQGGQGGQSGGPPGGGQGGGGQRGGPPPNSGQEKPSDLNLNFWFKPNQ